MIVLAIAGLIMVIVFIAVPQLQRAQRDNARQSIANRIKAEIETYAGNNQGLYPFSTCIGPGTTGQWCDFITRYISGKVNVKDPSTGNDVITASSGRPQAYVSTTNPLPPTTQGQIVIAYGAKCNGEQLTNSGTASPNSRTYALMIGLDRSNTVYCIDNG